MLSRYKAEECRKSDAVLLVESDAVQGERIEQLAGKNVLCIGMGRVIGPLDVVRSFGQ